MPICPNCENFYTFEEERTGKCPRCGYNVGSRYPEPDDPKPYRPNRTGTDISGTLSLTFSLIRDNFTTILVYLLIPILIVSAINIFTTWTLISAMEPMTAGEIDETYAENWFSTMYTIFLIFIPLSMISWMLEMLFAGGIVGMVKEGVEGKHMDVNTGFNVIKKHPLGLIGASIILTIVVSLGTALCLIPGLIFCYWWLFTIPIIVIEGVGISDAMSSSKKFAKDYGTMGFTIVLIILIVIMSVIGNIIGGAISGVSLFSLDPTMHQNFVWGPRFIVGQFIGVMISILVIVFAVMCIAVHYLRGRPSFKQQMPDFKEYYKPPPPPPTEDDYLSLYER